MGKRAHVSREGTYVLRKAWFKAFVYTSSIKVDSREFGRKCPEDGEMMDAQLVTELECQSCYSEKETLKETETTGE